MSLQSSPEMLVGSRARRQVKSSAVLGSVQSVVYTGLRRRPESQVDQSVLHRLLAHVERRRKGSDLT